MSSTVSLILLVVAGVFGVLYIIRRNSRLRSED
jgi:hypothetical protein